MKTLLLIILSAVVAVPALASADTLYLSSGTAAGAVQEQIDYAAVGTLFIPGSGGGSGALGSLGTEYSTLTIGDLNGDGYPDIMAMIRSAINGNQTPTNIYLEEVDAQGNVVWSVELDQAVVYKVHLGGSIAVKKPGYPNGPARPSVTFTSPLPPVQTGAARTFRPGRPTYGNISFTMPANPIGTGPQSVEVGDLTLSFPPAPAATGSTAPPIPEPLNITFDQSLAPVFVGWFASVVQNGQDFQPVTIQYSFLDGSTITLGLNMEIVGLKTGTDGVTSADSVVWGDSVDWGG